MGFNHLLLLGGVVLVSAVPHLPHTHKTIYDALHTAARTRRPIPGHLRRPPPTGGGGVDGSPPCPPDIGLVVNQTGFVSVLPFRRNVTDDDAVRAAINATRACGGNVFFPPGRYRFASTVNVPSRVGLFGSGGGVAQFGTPPQAEIIAPPYAPAFQIGSHTSRVHIANLDIVADTTGMIIVNSALVRLTNVGITVTHNMDHVNTSYPACSEEHCNIVFGSNNTALVIENCYWIWVQDSTFDFLPVYGPDGLIPRHSQGQRPSVILRGNANTIPPPEIDSCYLLRFERLTIAGGTFQYQQLTNCEQWPGFFDFLQITQEASGTPILDVQSTPEAKEFMGLQQVTITDASGADQAGANYLQPYEEWLGPHPRCGGGECIPKIVPVVAVNCSHPHCRLDGFTLTSVSSGEGAGGVAPAIRVFSGGLSGITIFSGQLSGSVDVVDAHNLPAGPYVSRSAGGFAIVGTATNDSDTGHANLSAWRMGYSRALTVGQRGDSGASFVLESDGAMRYGDGDAAQPFHTSLKRQVSNTSAYDPPPLAPGAAATTTVALRGAAVGDLLLASHTGMGASTALEISARCVKAGEALVIMRHVAGGGSAVIDPEKGQLRVAALQYL